MILSAIGHPNIILIRDKTTRKDDMQGFPGDSEAKLRPHERLALALTFLQIAIALAAITVLTKRRWLLWSSVASATIGIVTAVTAFTVR